MTGASPVRYLDRAGQSFTYLNVTAREGTVRPGGMLVVGFHGLGASEGQMETLVPIEMPSGSVYLSLRGLHRRGRDGFS